MSYFDPADYSLPGSSVHGILQARILGWVAIPFSRGFSQPRDRTRISCIAGAFFTNWAIREALISSPVYQEDKFIAKDGREPAPKRPPWNEVSVVLPSFNKRWSRIFIPCRNQLSSCTYPRGLSLPMKWIWSHGHLPDRRFLFQFLKTRTQSDREREREREREKEVSL